MVSYRLFSPGGNITALVEESVAAEERLSVSNLILESDDTIEQVGFIVHSSNTFQLEMMGKELCVNAGLAAALLWRERTGETSFSFSLSGTKGDVSAAFLPDSVRLTFPISLVRGCTLTPDGWNIDMDGMFALITNNGQALQDPERVLKESLGSSHPAGVLIYLNTSGDRVIIDPYVWVSDTQSFKRESSCGSGSIATAYALLNDDASSISIEQPSGALCSVDIDRTQGTIAYTGSVSEIFSQRTMSQTEDAIFRGSPRNTMV